MPLFDYRCNACSKRFTMMVGIVADQRDLACPVCGSADLCKLVGQIGSVRSEEQVLDDLSDIDKVGDMDDPKAVKRWVREMGKSMDDDMGDDLEQMLDEEEAGEYPGGGANAIY